MMVVAFGVLTGCQTASVEDLAPTQSLASQQPQNAPQNTGEYPKIGHIPVAETEQLGSSGTASLRNDLALARASQGAGAASPETYAEKMHRLKKLGLMHGQEALAEIEAR